MLTDEQCNEFRRLPLSFNDMVCAIYQAGVEAERMRIESAPVAVMDTRVGLGLCAPTEADFPALIALQGKRVRLVVDE